MIWKTLTLRPLQRRSSDEKVEREIFQKIIEAVR